MYEQPKDSTAEVKRLQRCMNDLVSVLALPAVWSGSEPSRILETFLDAVLAMLDLDFLYSRVKTGVDGEVFEDLKSSLRFASTSNAPDIRLLLHQKLGDDRQKWLLETRCHLRGQETSLLTMRLGIEDEIGIVLAGSNRADFPTQAERLLLSVATNQVVVGLQQFRLLNEQKRIANELEQRVAERTASLKAANAELRKEIADRQVVENRLLESEESLKRSEIRLRQVIDTIPTLSWSALPDGPSEFLSKTWHDFTGLSPEEALGWGWRAAIHPDDLPLLMEKRRKLFTSNQPGEWEARLRRRDGVYRWLLFRLAPLHDEGGKIVRWYGTGTDIDDRKVAEEALRASETDLRKILDSIPGLVCTLNLAGQIELANKPLTEYFGMTVEELNGWGTNNGALHPDDLPRVTAKFTPAMTTGTPYDIEVRYRRADGVYRWFQFRTLPVRDTEGRVTRWYCLIIDIEDRRRAEEELRASENNLRQIVDSIPGLVCTMDAAGEIQQLNRPLLEYFGKTSAELKGWKMTDAVHPDDLPRVVTAFSHSVTTGAFYEIEHRCRRADGVFRWFQVRASAVHDADDAISGWYVLLTDIEDRKLAENALRANERNLSQIINTIPTTAWSTRPDGYCEFLSDRWLDYAGFTFEEAVGWNWASAIHPDDADGLRECWLSSLASGTPVDTEARIRRFDGVYRWFIFRASPFRDDSGNIIRWYGTNIDIEDRKQADNALRAKERDLVQIINTLPILAWSSLPDGYVDFLNQRWLDFTGLSAEQAGGFGWSVAIHPDDANMLVAYWQASLASGRGVDVEARLRRFDGQFRWFLFRADPLRDDSGAIVKWYGTNIDIDERKRAEEALRIRELNLLQITETIPEMLWSASADGAIEYCNGRFLDYTGFTLEQVLSDGWMNVLHPEDVEPTVEVWKSCVESGAPYRVEVRTFHAADKTYRWCVTRALPLLDQERRIVRWHGTVVDMHDWTRAQEELRNTQAELARIMRVMTIGQLTASIAHEVSQPLSGIITNASTCLRMLNSEPPNVDGARETAQRTIRDGKRATDVITRLRTLFSKKHINIERVDLNEAAREVIALLSDELQKNRVTIRHRFKDRLPPVNGDRIQLQQVLLNLLRNASDSMVGVDDRPRRLLIRTDSDGNYATIHVQDSGVGFSQENADRLFESFFTTKQEGMGMGLSLSRSIVEAHRGRLWAIRNDGPGSTFAFSIPYDSEV